MSLLTFWIIGFVITFIVHILTYKLWNECLWNGWEFSRSSQIGESITFGIIFPVYWMMIMLLVITLIISFICSFIDDNFPL